MMRTGPDEAYEEFTREFIHSHRDAPPLWPVDRILVATDFSLCSLNALGHAEDLARKLDAELIVLHVEPVPTAGSDLGDVAHAAVERELARTAAGLRDYHPGVRTIVRAGAPDEEIVDAAATERASLVVMGTHGRTGLARALLGSVAESVVRRAPCPVLTIGPQNRG
jgi:nucleotide-binding universal stress UspA family protein